MIEQWKVKKLRDVCKIEKIPNREFDLPYVGLEHIESNTGKFIGSRNPQRAKSLTFKFFEKHLLYGRLRPYLNKVLIPGFEGHCSTEIFPIAACKELDTTFLFYWLTSNKIVSEINETCTGARMPRANMNAVLDIEIPLPPLSEQKRIVAILNEVFAGIDIAKTNIEKNLLNAEELFESHVRSVFASLSDGWETKKLGDKNILEIIDGDRGKNYPKKTDFTDTGFCLFLNTKNVRSEGFDFETTMFVSEEKDKELGNGKLQRNDVVMTTRGTIGNLGIFDNSVERDIIRINSGMLIFRPNRKIIMPEYLFEILKSNIIKTQIQRYVSGAAQPQLPIKTLVNFTFPVPSSVDEQQVIVRKLQCIAFEIKKLKTIYHQRLDDLTELKESILKKAFLGELAPVKPMKRSIVRL